jgi:hypothetical protein
MRVDFRKRRLSWKVLLLASTWVLSGCGEEEHQWGSPDISQAKQEANESEGAIASDPDGTEETMPPSDTSEADAEACFGQCESTTLSDTPFQTKPDAFGESGYSIDLEDENGAIVPSCLDGGIYFDLTNLSLTGDSELVDAWEAVAGPSAGQLVVKLESDVDDDNAFVVTSIFSATQVEGGYLVAGEGTETETVDYDSESQALSHSLFQEYEMLFNIDDDDDDDDDDETSLSIAETHITATLANDCSRLSSVELHLLIPAAQAGDALGEDSLVAALGPASTTLSDGVTSAFEMTFSGLMTAGEER